MTHAKEGHILSNMGKALAVFLLCLLTLSSYPQSSLQLNTNILFPVVIMTATAQTSTVTHLGQTPGGNGGSYSVGTITVKGTSLTTATFAVNGSSDGGVTFFPLNISSINAPGTTTTTQTVTANGIYQVNLSGITDVEYITSGTFTGTSIALTLTASPNGIIARSGGGGGGGVTPGTQFQIPAFSAGGVLLAGTNVVTDSTLNDLTIPGTSAASTSGLTVSGAPFTGGSTTTNFPMVYFNSGTAPTTWSATGTVLGLNAPTGFTGNFVDFHLNGGTSLFLVGPSGSVTASGSLSSGFKLSGSGLLIGGSKFSASGCTLGATTGGATAGTIVSGTTGTCTLVITMGQSVAAATDFSCYARDLTTPADTITQTGAASTTQATLTGTTVSGDIISFACIGH